MRPSLGRVVIYTRGPGEEYAATITRVDVADSVVGFDPKTLNDENTYRVFLMVLVHRDVPAPHGVEAEGRTWFTQTPVPFDDRDPPANFTWRWPPRV